MKRIVSGLLLLALLSGCTSAAMQKTPEDSGRDAPLTVVQESMPEDFAVRFTWLYALVCEDGFLDIRRPMISQELTTDDTLVAVMPNCWYEIRVTKNAEQYLICGDMTAAAYTQTDADAACFMKTVEALLGLVKGTSAWASLPEPNAAYE